MGTEAEILKWEFRKQQKKGKKKEKKKNNELKNYEGSSRV